MRARKQIGSFLVVLVALVSFSFAMLENHTAHADDHPGQKTECCSQCCPAHYLMNSDAYVQVEIIAEVSNIQLPPTVPKFAGVCSRVYRPPIV